MKKAITIISLLTLSGLAHADLYEASFTSVDNRARQYRYSLLVDLQFNQDGSIAGEVKQLTGAAHCYWLGVKVSGGNMADGNFRWATDESPTKGCGKIVFIGKKEGEKLVGHLPRFQGARVDLEFEPKK